MFVIDTNIFNFIIIKLGLHHCTASKPKLKMEYARTSIIFAFLSGIT